MLAGFSVSNSRKTELKERLLELLNLLEKEKPIQSKFLKLRKNLIKTDVWVVKKESIPRSVNEVIRRVSENLPKKLR